MPNDILITRNARLNDGSTSGATSNVGEPSVATNGSRMFVTGNWYASRSTNNGSSFSYVNPYNTTTPAAGGFCCDQLTVYDPRRRIWIWILQYRRSGASNVFRIAVSKNKSFPTGGWYWWDIAPTTLNNSYSNLWFDYPDAALSRKHLYVTFNMFQGNSWKRAAVMRFPLDTLANRGSLGFSWWSTTNNGSLRLTQQATPTSKMYFVSHQSTNKLRLFRWSDNDSNISFWNIGVNRWNGSISSKAPNNVDWLGRCDSRITAASRSGNKISVMWTAGKRGSRKHPYIRVVNIRESNKSVINQPDIWSNHGAWAYPAACHNRTGTLGFAAFFGGGGRNPGHIVGARDDSANKWLVRYSRLGTHSPNEAKWGDYMNCRADVPNSSSWVASGFTQEGGETRNDIIPRVVRFKMTSTGPAEEDITS